MKTLIISLVTLIFATSVNFGQKVSVGVLGGVNIQNFNGKDITGDKLENDLVIGYHAGVNALMNIAPDIYFQPGLLFSVKGSEYTDLSPNRKFKLNYLELPLNIVYRGLLGEGHVLLGFGPYAGYALGGKSIDANDVKSDLEFGSTIGAGEAGVNMVRRFDAGANIFAGYELPSGIFIQLNTQLGLLEINPEDRRIADDEASVKNTGFGISAGYRF